MKKGLGIYILVLALCALPALVQAGESKGVFCWQLSPYTDIICFDLENRSGFAYNMTGWDHGPGYYKRASDGAAVLNDYEGVYELQWQVGFSSFIIQFAGEVAPGNWNGTWFDDTGDSGSLVWMGPGPLAPGFEVEGIGTYEDSRR